jgi:hypothetical protein
MTLRPLFVKLIPSFFSTNSDSRTKSTSTSSWSVRFGFKKPLSSWSENHGTELTSRENILEDGPGEDGNGNKRSKDGIQVWVTNSTSVNFEESLRPAMAVEPYRNIFEEGIRSGARVEAEWRTHQGPGIGR